MWSSLFAMAANAVRGVSDAFAVPPPDGLIDMRSKAVAVYDGKPYRPKHRLWTKVTGVCLHQTACLLGERPERWATVGCHIGITRSGKVIWLHDFHRRIIHGNGWNEQTVGIEIDGLYAGIEGDPKTVWDDPSTAIRETGMLVTLEAMEAARQTVRWIWSEVGRRRGQIRALVAHRQASATRRNDPGSAIWRNVALPLHAELGVSDGGDGFAIDKGRPIPKAWDPMRTAGY